MNTAIQIHKRITHRKVCHKTEKLCGEVCMCGKYIVTVLFDNGIKKNYTRAKFDREFEIINDIPMLPEKKKISTSSIKEYGKKMVMQYLNTNYKEFLIDFRFIEGELYKVFFEHKYCGYIEFGDTIRVSYFVRNPLPQLHKYIIKWENIIKRSYKNIFNVSYEFTEVIPSDIKICLNNMVYASSENVDEFVENTR